MGPILPLSLLLVQLTCTHSARARSTVSPRRGVGPVLHIAALGEGQGQLCHAYAPEAGFPACCRWQEVVVGRAYFPYHTWRTREGLESALLLPCPQDWLPCAPANRVSFSALSRRGAGPLSCVLQLVGAGRTSCPTLVTQGPAFLTCSRWRGAKGEAGISSPHATLSQTVGLTLPYSHLQGQLICTPLSPANIDSSIVLPRRDAGPPPACLSISRLFHPPMGERMEHGQR